MKYHFKIINTVTDKVEQDSADFKDHGEPFKGFNTRSSAGITASCVHADEYENREGYYVYRVYPVPENVVEEDELEEHLYPGHETWPDEQHEHPYRGSDMDDSRQDYRLDEDYRERNDPNYWGDAITHDPENVIYPGQPDGC